MPTAAELSNLPAASEGDGSTSESNADGSTTTSFSDGTTRVDYADKSIMVTFTDGAVLNVYADGSRTLNDRNGASLDPATGQSLSRIPTPPLSGPDRVQSLLDGGEELKDLNEAKELVDTFKEAVKGEVNPATWFKQVATMIVQVVKALETEERGCEYRGWCYGVLYGALNMGSPPEPTFANSLGGPDQDVLDRNSWRSGVATATKQLADGAAGNALRNRLLFQVAVNGGDARTTLQALYQAACDQSDDWQLAKGYDHLNWPEPVGA